MHTSTKPSAEKLKYLLVRCVAKLRQYHEQTNGVYAGGENAGWLIDDIEKAIGPRPTDN